MSCCQAVVRVGWCLFDFFQFLKHFKFKICLFVVVHQMQSGIQYGEVDKQWYREKTTRDDAWRGCGCCWCSFYDIRQPVGTNDA